MAAPFTYVGGTGDYAGNILLDPDGLVTRTDLYDAIAEMNTRTTAVLDVPDWAPWAAGIAIALLAAIAACLVILAVAAMRRGHATTHEDRAPADVRTADVDGNHPRAGHRRETAGHLRGDHDQHGARRGRDGH